MTRMLDTTGVLDMPHKDAGETGFFFKVEDVKPPMNGIWDTGLNRVGGIGSEFLTGDHGPCPKCGGTDRWRFTNLDGNGSAICNQCGKFGDGLAVLKWWLNVEFPEVLKLVGDFAGVQPREKTKRKSEAKSAGKDPMGKIEVQDWNSKTVAHFCHHKKGISSDGMRACGAECVRYQFKKSSFNCVAIRILGEDLSVEDPAGIWIIEAFGGKLPAKNGVVKHKVTFGSTKGIAMTVSLADSLRNNRDLSGLTVYKVEGLPDLLSIASQGVDVLAFSSSNGSEEKPLPWFIDQLGTAKPRGVIVIPDADEPGTRGADTWAKMLAKKLDDVRIARLPFDVESTHGKDFRDFVVGGGTLTQINEIASNTEPEVGRKPGHVGPDGRVAIELSDNENELISNVIPELNRIEGLYQRGGELVEKVVSAHPIASEINVARVRPIALSKLRARVSGKVAFFIETEDGDVLKRISDTIAKQVRDWGEYPDLPELSGVSEFPFIRPDGSICSTNGYDAASKTFLETNLKVTVADAPSLQDCNEAADRILALVKQFDFQGCGRSSWLAGLLTLFARPSISGCVPMWIIEASVQGSGKTRLVDVIGVIAFGRMLVRNNWPTKEDEVAKSLTAIALSGIPVVLFDNCKTILGGPSLEAFTTSETWKSRILGESRETAELPIRQVVFATGNNATFTLDIARRSCFVRLEPQHEDPSSRTFEIPDLLGHVKEHRNELASDVLTILRGFISSNDKPVVAPWGGFEDWSRLIRGTILWLGLDDPYKGTSEAKNEASSSDLLPELIDAMTEAQVNERTAREIIETANKLTMDGQYLYPDLRDVLDSGCHGRKLNTKLVGNFLKRYAGRIHCDQKIVSEIDPHKKIKKWSIKTVVTKSDQTCGVAGLRGLAWFPLPLRMSQGKVRVRNVMIPLLQRETCRGPQGTTPHPATPQASILHLKTRGQNIERKILCRKIPFARLRNFFTRTRSTDRRERFREDPHRSCGHRQTDEAGHPDRAPRLPTAQSPRQLRDRRRNSYLPRVRTVRRADQERRKATIHCEKDPNCEGVRMKGHMSATSTVWSPDRSHRFVGGRKALNARRTMLAEIRRKELVGLMRSADLNERGWRSRLSEALRVNKSTITRDLAILAAEANLRSITAADADLDRRFAFLSMLVQSLDPDQSRRRALQDARKWKAAAGDARESVADHASDHANDRGTDHISDGGDHNEA